jgi:hypothetical protein
MLTENKFLLVRIRDSTIGFSDALFYIYRMVMHENMVKNEFLFSSPSDAENFHFFFFGEAQEYFFL